MNSMPAAPAGSACCSAPRSIYPVPPNCNTPGYPAARHVAPADAVLFRAKFADPAAINGLPDNAKVLIFCAIPFVAPAVLLYVAQFNIIVLVDTPLNPLAVLPSAMQLIHNTLALAVLNPWFPLLYVLQLIRIADADDVNPLVVPPVFEYDIQLKQFPVNGVAVFAVATHSHAVLENAVAVQPVA